MITKPFPHFAACSDIDNCNSCTNPPLQCYTCKADQTLNKAKTGCLDCPDNCLNCYNVGDDEPTCNTCATGYLLDEEDGTCAGKNAKLIIYIMDIFVYKMKNNTNV